MRYDRSTVNGITRKVRESGYGLGLWFTKWFGACRFSRGGALNAGIAL
jgi:hypothetical protein